MAFIKKVDKTEPIRKKSIDDFYLDAKNKGINPFDIFKYVDSFDDIDISYMDLGDNSGKIEFKDGIYMITINKYHSDNRQRFTLAHEFGHYILHKNFLKNSSITDGALFRKDYTNDEKEYEANEFAAKLLMPENKFRQAIEDGCDTINKLAEYFKVSSSAVKYRAYKLGLIRNY